MGIHYFSLAFPALGIIFLALSLLAFTSQIPKTVKLSYPFATIASLAWFGAWVMDVIAHNPWWTSPIPLAWWQ